MGRTGTRAGATGVITTDNLKTTEGAIKTAGFGVYGYLHSAVKTDGTAIAEAPNFMWNEQVTSNGTSWSYAPVKYWPNGEDGNNTTPSNTATQDNTNPKMLSFFAYAPWVSAGAASTGITAIPANNATDLKISYQLPSTITDASTIVDLLWGKRGNSTGYSLADGTESDAQKAYNYNINLTKQNTTETVDFLFKHALAKIGGYDNTNSKSGIKVVYDIDANGSAITGGGATDANTLVTIKEITIKNKTTGDPAKSTLYAKGKFDISTGTWSEQAVDNDVNPTVNITISADNMNTEIAEPTALSTPGTVTHPSGWSPVGVTTSAKDVYVGTNVDPIFFIPGVAQELEVEVEYLVRTYDAGLNSAASGSEGTWTKVTQKIKNTVTLPAGTLPNKYYTLVIHIGLTSVKFSATVDNWEGATAGDGNGENPQVIWLPSNVTQ